MFEKKIDRLTILNSKSGLPIFDYIDENNTVKFDEILYTGIIKAFSIALSESLGLGNIREIKLEQGNVLFFNHEEFLLTFIIVTQAESKELDSVLSKFVESFIEKYSPYLSNPNNTTVFNTAINMVNSCFA